MKTLTDHLSNYAAYHRDPRNLVTHLVGIPLIVVAAATLLSRPTIGFGPVAFSPAWMVAAAATVFYLRLDVRFGLAMAVALGASVAVGRSIAALPTATWLACGVGAFVAGWIIQFIGHYYERRKPAFVDDLTGLAIGPLFVAAEVGFMLKLRLEVRHAIEQRVGPMRSGVSAVGREAGVD